MTIISVSRPILAFDLNKFKVGTYYIHGFKKSSTYIPLENILITNFKRITCTHKKCILLINTLIRWHSPWGKLFPQRLYTCVELMLKKTCLFLCHRSLFIKKHNPVKVFRQANAKYKTYFAFAWQTYVLFFVTKYIIFTH